MIFSLSLAKSFSLLLNLKTAKVGSPNNDGPKERQNMFATTRLFFMFFTIAGVKKIIRHIEVPTVSDKI